jgi:hypothetical protein
LPADLKKLRGWHAIARQKSVHRFRRGVARMPGIEQKRFAAAASKNKRGAETGGASANNDDLEHADKSQVG